MWASNTLTQHPLDTEESGSRSTEMCFSPVPVLLGVRAVKVLILTATIHYQQVTMVQPARVSFTVQTRRTIPKEKRRKPTLTETRSLDSP